MRGIRVEEKERWQDTNQVLRFSYDNNIREENRTFINRQSIYRITDHWKIRGHKTLHACDRSREQQAEQTSRVQRSCSTTD